MASKKKKKSAEKRGFKARLNAMRDLLIGPSEDAPGEQPLAEEQPVDLPEAAAEDAAPQDDSEIESLQLSDEQLGNSVKKTDSEPDEIQASDHSEQDANPGEVDLEQIVEDLHTAKSVSDRVMAVRKLGKSRNQRAAPHLVAAMFDDEPQVRLAAEEAMAQLDNVAVSSPVDTPQEVAKDSSSADAEELSSDAKAVIKSQPQSKELNGMAHLHLESEEGVAKESNPPAQSPQISASAGSTDDEQKLIQEHEAARKIVDELHHEIFKVVAARTGQEKQASWRIKREAKLRTEIAERIRGEEEARKRAEEEAQARRTQESEALEAERDARMQAEAEAQRMAQEESRLRLEAANQSRTAEEIIQRHAAMVVAREEADLEAQRVAAARGVAEAQQRQRTEIERLHQEEERYRLATEETARQREAVEAARQREEQDAATLAEAQERMRTAEEVRAKAEATRAQLETELLEHVEKEERLLSLARQQGDQERQRLTEEFRQHQESLEQELATKKAEADQARLEAEQRNQNELEQLREQQEALQAATEEASRVRSEVEAAIARAKKDAAEHAVRKSEADEARLAAEQRNQTELERLRKEQETLNTASEKASRLRGEVEVARTLEEKEIQELAEAQKRMRAAEQARATAEAERVKIEAELLERVDKGERLLAEAKQRALAEQRRLESEAKKQQKSAEQRLAEAKAASAAAEEISNRLAQREQELRSQIESLQNADAEARKRISAAEAKKHGAEQAVKLISQQIQRLETESHASVAEEQRVVAKFETEKRNALTAAKARAEHEKQIREELEALRRSADEDNNRLKTLAMQRAQAEEVAKKYREDCLAEEEALRIAEAESGAVRSARPADVESEESIRQAASLVGTTAKVEAVVPEPTMVEQTGTSELTPETAVIDQEEAVEEIPDAVASYLKSVDPYKRAAAVAEIARSKPDDAFGLIITCFDDQSSQVRNAAALALRTLDPPRIVDSFNRALEAAPAGRRTNIGAAIAGSGLASEAVNNLASESREDTYNALSILFVMAKAGEINPLVQAIEEHENDEVRRAVVKLLTLSGHSAAGDAALQRRVLGVPSNRQRAQKNVEEPLTDVRSGVAEAEVKRAANGKHKTSDEKPESGTN